MKILAISDQRLPEMERVDYLRRTYADAEFIISCGDMEQSYIEFVSSALNLPVFYVRGNHDESYTHQPPGGDDLHMRFKHYKGISMVGLEGSMYYNGKNVQYNNLEMWIKVLRLTPRLLINRFRKGYGVDYLVTHSPPFGIHDRTDVPHRGFKSFLWLMRITRPRYLIHGHIDIWDRRDTIETQYYGTRVININPKRLLEPNVDDPKSPRSSKKD